MTPKKHDPYLIHDPRAEHELSEFRAHSDGGLWLTITMLWVGAAAVLSAVLVWRLFG